MSNDEQRAALGKLLEDYGETRRKLAEAAAEMRHLAETLAALAASLRIGASGELPEASRANQIVASIPDDFTPSRIRALIAAYSALKGSLESQRSQLKPYGVE